MQASEVLLPIIAAQVNPVTWASSLFSSLSLTQDTFIGRFAISIADEDNRTFDEFTQTIQNHLKGIDPNSYRVIRQTGTQRVLFRESDDDFSYVRFELSRGETYIDFEIVSNSRDLIVKLQSALVQK